MARPGHRRPRLPQHHDYVLVPPPPDFQPPDEKSPLPAIIVTPSSPSCSADFSVAFIAPPAKPTLIERVLSVVAPLQTKARTTLILILLFFILAAHLLAHRLATRHPYLQFDATPAAVRPDVFLPLVPVSANSHSHSHAHSHGHGVGFLDWKGLWQADERATVRHEFVVTESEDAVAPLGSANSERGPASEDEDVATAPGDDTHMT